jgi:hypothetical protein
VGYIFGFRKGCCRSLVEYWNGKAWKLQKSPMGGFLFAVAATSPTNAWAVGDEGIEHWNGRSWQIQKSTGGGSLKGGILYGVAATSPTNAWAVGELGQDIGPLLILHWNGKSWKLQKHPIHAHWAASSLNSVTATSAANAWAVGSWSAGHGNRTLVMHWNGTAWKIQTSPSPHRSQYGVQLRDVAATSRNNAWAVGSWRTGHHGSGTLLEHWNGKVWNVQPSASNVSSNTALDGVAATSRSNAWVVGYTASQTLVEHWGGHAWKVQPTPDPGVLLDVAATSRTNAWAVGGSDAVHWNGTAWGP